MAADKIFPVLLAGGVGSRLWPLSRDSLPKQFQPLTGPLSTYQQALQRVADPVLFEDAIVITGEAFGVLGRRRRCRGRFRSFSSLAGAIPPLRLRLRRCSPNGGNPVRRCSCWRPIISFLTMRCFSTPFVPG